MALDSNKVDRHVV